MHRNRCKVYQSNLPTDNVRKPGGPRRSLNPLSAHLHGTDHPFKGVVGLFDQPFATAHQLYLSWPSAGSICAGSI